MQLPSIGELNRRVRIYAVSTTPEDDADYSNGLELVLSAWAKVEPVGGVNYWGSVQADSLVTHRMWLRYSKSSRTTPELLPRAARVEFEGVWYSVKRATDANGAHRFTLLECEALYGGSD